MIFLLGGEDALLFTSLAKIDSFQTCPPLQVKVELLYFADRAIRELGRGEVSAHWPVNECKRLLASVGEPSYSSSSVSSGASVGLENSMR
jgi:hypothetical protein